MTVMVVGSSASPQTRIITLDRRQVDPAELATRLGRLDCVASAGMKLGRRPSTLRKNQRQLVVQLKQNVAQPGLINTWLGRSIGSFGTKVTFVHPE